MVVCECILTMRRWPLCCMPCSLSNRIMTPMYVPRYMRRVALIRKYTCGMSDFPMPDSKRMAGPIKHLISAFSSLIRTSEYPHHRTQAQFQEYTESYAKQIRSSIGCGLQCCSQICNEKRRRCQITSRIRHRRWRIRQDCILPWLSGEADNAIFRRKRLVRRHCMYAQQFRKLVSDENFLMKSQWENLDPEWRILPAALATLSLPGTLILLLPC